MVYAYDPTPWYWDLAGYLFQLLFAAAVLSPFAAVAAWYLNRRHRQAGPAGRPGERGPGGGDADGDPHRGAARAVRHGAVVQPHEPTKLKKGHEGERDFLMSIGQRLKTPLTAIDGYTKLLPDGAVGPRRRPRS